MKALPLIAFEVIRSKLLLLMRLIANPSCLDQIHRALIVAANGRSPTFGDNAPLDPLLLQTQKGRGRKKSPFVRAITQDCCRFLRFFAESPPQDQILSFEIRRIIT